MGCDIANNLDLLRNNCLLLLLTNSSGTSAQPSIVIHQSKPQMCVTEPRCEDSNAPEVFNGIQAHVSACASHKVSEVVANVPCNFQLEEVSHNSSWPLQFPGISPQEENIALFFFAKDIQSYDRGYKELVERMLRNDSALKGNIDGTELLIFTSTKLPLNSQRWNSMHYLWGMFRVKRRHCLPLMAIQEKPSLPNLNVELISQDLPMWHLKSVHSGTNNSKTSSKLTELVSHGMILGESGDCVEDLHYITSDIGDKKCRTSLPLVENGFEKTANNPRFTEEQLSFAVANSSGTSTQPSKIVDIHQSKPQMCVTEPRCEENSNGIYQKKAVTDCIDYKTGELPVRSYDVEVESNPQRATLILPASQNCNIQDPGAECSSFNRIVADDCSPSAFAEPIGDAFETDRISCESGASRKHGRSSSLERVLQPFGEFFMNSAKTELASGWPSWMHVAWETERKKICHVSGRSPSDSDLNTRLSSKVHPIHSSISTSQEHGELEPVVMANLGTPEMCFFPADIFPEKKNKNLCNNITVSQSSDDNDTPESSTLDLELTLGRKNESKKPTLSMFAARSVHGGNGHLGNGDASASLSLSLSFRPSESDTSDRRILEAEQAALFQPCSFGQQ
ncbi:hypothetical protein HPP92_014186 [Vanilla planifolia]|uniref:AIPP2-like SPOC-like domain-containing protein n=1 Tax=Vanilla planifolia TaxID=51239 RepID=A0A835QJJ7_VANPL|nr:hypothetical protein HPP92_014186 [Vanilla planifolia]